MIMRPILDYEYLYLTEMSVERLEIYMTFPPYFGFRV